VLGGGGSIEQHVLRLTCHPHFSTCVNNCHTTIHILDDLGNCVYARGFGDGFHEGIVSLLILGVNPHRTLNAVLGRFIMNNLVSVLL
jgi:hypothetical protein